MKDKKFQIFVSSTYTDLKEERQAAVEAILSAGHIPAGMELFSAGDESQMTVIKRWIDESDIYLLILGGRYGTIEPKSGKSYTHLEFEYALEQKKPIFSVVIKEEALSKKVKIMGINAIEQENPKELKEFRAVVTSNMVEFWYDKKDIQLAIFKTLSDFTYSKELTGWVRADNVANNALVADEIARLTKENSDLREKVSMAKIESLYFGLTFDQLIELLGEKKSKTNNEPLNIPFYIYDNGQKFVNGVYSIDKYENEIIKVLLEFGIIKIDRFESSEKYIFSKVGHDFYIKSLYEYKILG